jgi:hypothetical protein
VYGRDELPFAATPKQIKIEAMRQVVVEFEI